MQTEVSLFFAQLAEVINSIPFVTIIGTTFVISFLLKCLELWRGGD